MQGTRTHSINQITMDNREQGAVRRLFTEGQADRLSTGTVSPDVQIIAHQMPTRPVRDHHRRMGGNSRRVPAPQNQTLAYQMPVLGTYPQHGPSGPYGTLGTHTGQWQNAAMWPNHSVPQGNHNYRMPDGGAPVSTAFYSLPPPLPGIGGTAPPPTFPGAHLPPSNAGRGTVQMPARLPTIVPPPWQPWMVSPPRMGQPDNYSPISPAAYRF